jgi:hypothetical protein
MSITMNNNHENTMKNLEQYRKEPGFTVPDGYYDDLYEKMMGRIAVEHHKSKNNKKYFWFSIGGSAVAATIALLVTVTILNQNIPTDYVAGNITKTLQIEQPTVSNSNSKIVQTIELTPTPELNEVQEIGTGSSKIIKNTTVASSNKENIVDIEDPVYEFYAEDARSDQFQEALMDLECYYEF